MNQCSECFWVMAGIVLPCCMESCRSDQKWCSEVTLQLLDSSQRLFLVSRYFGLGVVCTTCQWSARFIASCCHWSYKDRFNKHCSHAFPTTPFPCLPTFDAPYFDTILFIDSGVSAQISQPRNVFFNYVQPHFCLDFTHYLCSSSSTSYFLLFPFVCLATVCSPQPCVRPCTITVSPGKGRGCSWDVDPGVGLHLAHCEPWKQKDALWSRRMFREMVVGCSSCNYFFFACNWHEWGSALAPLRFKFQMYCVMNKQRYAIRRKGAPYLIQLAINQWQHQTTLDNTSGWHSAWQLFKILFLLKSALFLYSC